MRAHETRRDVKTHQHATAGTTTPASGEKIPANGNNMHQQYAVKAIRVAQMPTDLHPLQKALHENNAGPQPPPRRENTLNTKVPRDNTTKPHILTDRRNSPSVTHTPHPTTLHRQNTMNRARTMNHTHSAKNSQHQQTRPPRRGLLARTDVDWF